MRLSTIWSAYHKAVEMQGPHPVLTRQMETFADALSERLPKLEAELAARDGRGTAQSRSSRADAALGAAVRAMPVSWRLSHTDTDRWELYRVDTLGRIILWDCNVGTLGTTPNEALGITSIRRADE